MHRLVKPISLLKFFLLLMRKRENHSLSLVGTTFMYFSDSFQIPFFLQGGGRLK